MGILWLARPVANQLDSSPFGAIHGWKTKLQRRRAIVDGRQRPRRDIDVAKDGRVRVAENRLGTGRSAVLAFDQVIIGQTGCWQLSDYLLCRNTGTHLRIVRVCGRKITP